MENLVLYDWVSITSKIHSPEQMISLLGMEGVSWEQIKGAHGYKDRLYWNCISIHFNGSDDMGVWLELSGQGCRAFESFGHGDYEFLFSVVRANPEQMKFTRLDIAFDDHTGLLDMNTLISDTLANNYVAKATSWEVVQSNKGTSVIIGSRQSPVLIRIYDKAAERGYKEGSTRGDTSPLVETTSPREPQFAETNPAPAGANQMINQNHWIRIELQLRDNRASEFVCYQMDHNFEVGETFSGVLLNYLRYVVPDELDSNKWRWPLTDYWAVVVGAACAIPIYVKPGVQYNLLNCEKLVFEQYGNAISALLQIYDFDTFMDKLQHRKCRPNPKYTRMVKNYLAGDILNENA